MVQTDNSQSHWFSLSKYILWFFYNFYEEIVKESFNTSHVTLYQSAGRPGIPRCRVSIHHMLLFIVIAYAADGITKLFQYITCYSLSLLVQLKQKLCQRFNTSHVTLYLLQTTQILHMEEVSIHHMLLFITFREHTLHGCSFVSIHHMLLFICSRQDSGENVPGFQYITCYSLSKKRVRKNTGRILFQYITCYSLSPPSPVSAPPTEVFQYITCYSLSGILNIPAYLLFPFQYITCYSLSGTGLKRGDVLLKFQYITCYSLSDVQHLLLVNYIGFNTSHVTLYHSLLKISFLIIPFQYITCYSLSIELADKVLPKNRFNTSHVTLYQSTARSL